MAIAAGAERINPIGEVQGQVGDFWATVIQSYVEIYGKERSQWPARGWRFGPQQALVDPKGRKLKIDLRPGTVVEARFSQREGDDSMVGLTVTKPGISDFISERVIRQRIIGGYPSHEFVWTVDGRTEADLAEARLHLDSRNSVRYYGQPSRTAWIEFRQWQRVWQGAGGPSYDMPDNKLARSTPEVLDGETNLHGERIKWSLNVMTHADQVIESSGLRKMPSVLPPFRLR